MAKISIVKKSDILEARRFDAECFISLNELHKKYSKDIDLITLSDKNYIEIIDGDRGKNYPNGDDFSNNEYCLFLNTSNVLKSGFNLENSQFITKNKDEILGNGKLKKLDIVFTTRGTIGNIGIYNNEIKFNHIRINSGMVIFRLKNIIQEYFFILLLTNYFKIQIEAYSSGSVQKQIPINTIKQLKIPILPQSFQLQIEKIVKEAHQKQTKSKQLYKEAKQLLLEELDLVYFQAKHKLTFQTTKEEISKAKRFDSEYFQPRALQLRNFFEGKNSIKVKSAITGSLVSGSTPKSGGDGYTENGKIKFIRAVNLNNLVYSFTRLYPFFPNLIK